MTLRVTRAATSAIRGRLLGTDGRPISNASVRVQFRNDKGPRAGLTSSMHFDGSDEIRTAADGTFQTPQELDLALDYRAVAIAEGFVSESTDFIKPAPGEINVLPDLLLRRALKLRTVTGRVVQPAGAPPIRRDGAPIRRRSEA